MNRHSSRFALHASSRRRGITLIEVLMSIFVLTFGLLGIAMVIPAGRALMTDAAKSDRSSACGRAVLNDIQVRGWNNPEEWRHMWGDLAYSPARITTRRAPPPITPEWVVSDIPGGLIYGETYFLDPAFFESNSSIASVRHFPYSAYPTREFALTGTSADRQWPDRAMARRLTVGLGFPPGSNLQKMVRAAVAARLTTWSDELNFSLESDDVRPRQMVSWLDTSTLTTASENAAAPVLPADGFDSTNKERQAAVSENRYTWSVMITPLVPARADGRWDHDDNVNTDPVPLVNPGRITRYEVSVVVFYNRNFYCPTDGEIKDATDAEMIHERSVYAQIIGDGIGGGEVLLFVTGDGSGTTSVPANPPAGYLNVRKNDWIMLKALDASRHVNQFFSGGPPDDVIPTRPAVCKWYRVLGVDDEITENPDGTPLSIPDPNNLTNKLTGRGRYVSLAGPDWQIDTTYNGTGFDPSIDIAEAALVDDVVGVYTTIIDVNAL